MELREGYKQTEVGLIPEDWLVTRLGDVGHFKNGINKGSEFFGHGSPFVNLLDVFGNNALLATDSFGLMDSNDTEKGIYNLKEGDVIFIRSSVKPSGVGLTVVITADLPNTVYSGFLIRYRDKGKIDTNYKKYCFYEEKFRRNVISASSVSANTNINQDSLKRLILALPPTKTEQTAIANALSDADALIQSLTRLIAKKRLIKQGAMQTLLNPYENGRLKAGWSFEKVKDCADISTGSKNTQDKVSDGIYPFFVRSQTVEKINSYSFDGEAILTAGDGVGTGKVFHYINGKFNFHQRVYIISGFKESVDGYYLFLNFSNNFYNRIMQMTAKSSVDSVRMEMIADMTIPFPSTKKEQTHIATILSDMDADITALETKLAKTQQIKQGMMQNLLTGKIRLV